MRQKIMITCMSLLFMFGMPVFAEDTSADETISSGYLLQPDDVIRISVWKEADMQIEMRIRPDGKISFPLVGHILAEGRTPEQLEEEVSRRLSGYIPDAVVNVMLLTPTGNKIYVIGKVLRPSEYQVGGPIDIMQALSKAGGPSTYAAVNDIKILRRIKGKQTVLSFRYSDLEEGKNLGQNILLKAGDVVVVP